MALGTAAARPPSTLWLAPPQLVMAADLHMSPIYAAATWVAMIALQVGVGHGLLDKTAPSAAAEPVAPQSVLLNVCITWDSRRRRPCAFPDGLAPAAAPRLVVVDVELG